ncbi:60S ribosomal protein L31 [Patescibacteria group bacterium]|nr:60S ribosomal protein L31 [Patescibacteria group bacterium]
MAEKKGKKTEEREEREYIIPLRANWTKVPRYKRANKAVKTIKEFLARHMKVRDRDLNKIKLEGYINEFVWLKGIKKPPVKIKVKVFKDGEIVRAKLSELPEKLKFKKEREQKMEEKAHKSIEKKKEEVKKNEEEMSEKKTPERTEEDEKKEKEKTISGEESMKKLEKEASIREKHMSKSKVKEPKHQKRMALKK